MIIDITNPMRRALAKRWTADDMLVALGELQRQVEGLVADPWDFEERWGTISLRPGLGMISASYPFAILDRNMTQAGEVLEERGVEVVRVPSFSDRVLEVDRAALLAMFPTAGNYQEFQNPPFTAEDLWFLLIT